MKSVIFQIAISRRKRISFLYGTELITVDPYFIGRDKNGAKVLFGRAIGSKEIKKYYYSKMANIKTFERTTFAPIIPIISIN